MSKKFDPTQYKNKKTVYPSLAGHPGISTIWDWSPRRKKYCKRTIGNKFYAVKRSLGRQVTKSFTTLSAAQKWRFDNSDELARESKEITFEKLLVKFFKKKKSEVRESTFEKYENHLRHLVYFNKFRISEITPRRIDAWLDHLKSPKYLRKQQSSRLSYEKVLGLLNQILGYYSEYICEDTGYSIPIKKRHRTDCIVNREAYDMKKARNKEKFLPRSVVVNFLNQLRMTALDNPVKEEVYFVLALFQFSTGVRIGELCALDWQNLNFVDNTAYIRRSVFWSRRKGGKTKITERTKNGENRKVYLTKEVANRLKKWSLKTGRSKGLVFSYDGKIPLEYRNVQHRYDKASKKIGSKWTGTHIARHSFATDFLSKTKNPKALQSILGHKTSQQTDHYAKITEELTKEGVALYQESFSEFADAIELSSC